MPPLNSFQQLAADLFRNGATSQQMLGAEDLRCFGQDGGSALGYDMITGESDGRIGRDARVAIGTAAFGGHDQLVGRNGFRVARH